MNFLTLPYRAIIGRPVRSALTVLGIAVAIAGLVALTGLTRGIQVSLESGFSESGADLMISQPGAFTLSSSTVPQSLGQKLSAVQGVQEATGVMFSMITADDEANIIAVGWPESSAPWKDLALVGGRVPDPGERGSVVVGEAVAKTLRKNVGDTIELHFRQFRIVGIARFASVLSQNMAVLVLDEMQALLGRQGTVTFFEIKLQRPVAAAALERARAALSGMAPGLAIFETRQLVNDLRLVRLVRAIASTISIVVIFLALLGTANTILMAVNERAFDIGVLSTLGWSAPRIVGLIVLEGLGLAISGAVLGIMLGVGAMILAEHSPMAAGLLQAYVDRSIIGQAIAAAVVIGIAGAAYPAWRATRANPAQSLRRL